MKCLKEKCIHHDVCALYTFSGYASDECGFYETKPHVENEKLQWIPCSERLPEKNGRYIVTEKRFAIDDRKHIRRYQTVVEEVNFSNNIWNRANFIEVIAWMPIPEPYKEGDQK